MEFCVYFVALLAISSANVLEIQSPTGPGPYVAPVERCLPQTFTTLLTQYSFNPMFERITSYYHEPPMTYQVEKMVLSTITETMTVDMTSKRSIFISKHISTVFSPTFTTELVTKAPTRFEVDTSRVLLTQTVLASVTLTEPVLVTVEFTSTVTKYDNVEASLVDQADIRVVTVVVTSTSRPLYEATVTVTENLDEVVQVTFTVPVSRRCNDMSETVIFETLPVTSVSYITRTRTATMAYRPGPGGVQYDHINYGGPTFVEAPLRPGIILTQNEGSGHYVEGGVGDQGAFGSLFGGDQNIGGSFFGLKKKLKGLGGQSNKGGQQNKKPGGILMSVIGDLKKNLKKL